MQNKKAKQYLMMSSAFLTLASTSLMAGDLTLGSMASTITQSFTSLTKLITAGSYIGGLAFFIGAIMKFKQHKDNPTNIQLGVPVTLTLVAAALLFLPTILQVAGGTMFGSGGASTSGPTGSVFSAS
ncbi:MAG: type IV secretion protein IcmD [Legionella sp. 21-45-4]|nr:MAG: type IV secretion protein IcmD [Legionella sp. 21-45-4]